MGMHRNECSHPCCRACGTVQWTESKRNRRGYAGLLEEDIIDMHTMSVTDIVQREVVRSFFTSRCEEMRTPEGQKKGSRYLP